MLGKIFRRWHYRRLSERLIKDNYYARLEFEDRDTLERIILPYVLSDLNPKRILDVGREDYQSWYNDFFDGRELWTLDFNKRRKKFGAPNHITDDVANVGAHFKPGYFHFILLNGVFGWGLNDIQKIEKTFDSLYELLAPGGLLIVGWNDLEDLVPIPLANIKALKRFQKYTFPPLKKSSFLCIGEGRHTYNFYLKK
ncbi:MAG: hypothetical protein WCO55_00690 [Candidatus Falkowbacteria bacterium]